MKARSTNERLRPSLHYMLALLATGPRFYSGSLGEIVRLQKRGYAVLTGVTRTNGSREWEITAAGRNALQAYGGSKRG